MGLFVTASHFGPRGCCVQPGHVDFSVPVCDDPFCCALNKNKVGDFYWSQSLVDKGLLFSPHRRITIVRASRGFLQHKWRILAGCLAGEKSAVSSSFILYFWTAVVFSLVLTVTYTDLPCSGNVCFARMLCCFGEARRIFLFLCSLSLFFRSSQTRRVKASFACSFFSLFFFCGLVTSYKSCCCRFLFAHVPVCFGSSSLRQLTVAKTS